MSEYQKHKKEEAWKGLNNKVTIIQVANMNGDGLDVEGLEGDVLNGDDLNGDGSDGDGLNGHRP